MGASNHGVASEFVPGIHKYLNTTVSVYTEMSEGVVRVLYFKKTVRHFRPSLWK